MPEHAFCSRIPLQDKIILGFWGGFNRKSEKNNDFLNYFTGYRRPEDEFTRNAHKSHQDCTPSRPSEMQPAALPHRENRSFNRPLLAVITHSKRLRAGIGDDRDPDRRAADSGKVQLLHQLVLNLA